MASICFSPVREGSVGQARAIQVFRLFEMVVTAVKQRQAEARITDEWEALFAGPRRLDHRYRGEVGRRIADDRTVQLFGTILVVLLLTDEREALNEGHIKRAFFRRTVLSRKRGAQNSFSLHILRIADEIVGVYVLQSTPQDL
jgi:hypothetical protein